VTRPTPALVLALALALALGLALLATPEAVAQARRKSPPTKADMAARGFRALQARVKVAANPAECAAIAADIEQANPGVAAFVAAALPEALERRLGGDPEATYHDANPAERAALIRRAWGDAIQKGLELRAAAAPQEGTALARTARARLPERPDLPPRLLEAAARDISSLRQADVEALAGEYDRAGRPDRARNLKRRWLDDQREHRLGGTDAEGRIGLANQYRGMLGDAATAATLLQDALRLDPGSPAAAAALEGLGYRKDGDRWLPPRSAEASSSAPEPAQAQGPAREPGGSLGGMTRDEVRRRLGKPDRIARVASQGRVVEQWVYDAQYINFLRRDARSEPVVTFHGPIR